MFEIVERQELAQGTIISNWIKAPKIAAKAQPGQFVILRANETGERIPLTMADTDPEKGLVNIIYMVIGKSTALFKTLQVGDSYLDVIGPLGAATHLEKVGKVICVGGGTGIAVLHPIARGLKQLGNEVFAVIGARSKDLLIMEDRMKVASNELMICTDDGTYGHQGFVTDKLKETLEKHKDIGLAVCIGPVPMMRVEPAATRSSRRCCSSSPSGPSSAKPAAKMTANFGFFSITVSNMSTAAPTRMTARSTSPGTSVTEW